LFHQKYKKWLLVAFILAYMFALARADESVEDVSEDEDVATDDETEAQQPMSTGVFSRAFLHNVADNKFAAGEYVTSLVAFRSEPENPNYRIIFVIGHLKESTYFVQNFTGNSYSRLVTPGESTTVKYRFKADPSLESRDYELVIQVFFQNEDNTTYVTTAYNGTVTITDAATTFDAATFFTYAALIGGVVAGGYFFKNKFASARPKKQVSEMGTESKAIDKEFVSKQHLRYEESRKASASPKRTASSGRK